MKTPLVGMATPHWPDDYRDQKTPMMGDGGMTPLHSFNERGDQTHVYQTPRGDRTPLHEDGAKTPSHDVWLPQTPRHTPHTPRSPPESPRETDVEREIGELEGNSSSSTLNPVTPGLPTPSEHRLPSTPATPATPVDRRPVDEEEDLTSPAPSPIPQDVRDPRTPSNPATPVSTPIMDHERQWKPLLLLVFEMELVDIHGFEGQWWKHPTEKVLLSQLEAGALVMCVCLEIMRLMKCLPILLHRSKQDLKSFKKLWLLRVINIVASEEC